MRNFAIGLVIGLGAGATGSYFITKDICERNEQLHIQEMRKMYEEKYKPKNVSVQKDDPADIVKGYNEAQELYSGKSDNVDPAEAEVPSEDSPDEYYENEDLKEKKYREEVEKAHEYDKKHRNNVPKIISEEDFSTGVPGFESKEVSYYTDDDTYVYDDSDEVVEDPAFCFGNVIKNLHWDSDDSQTDDIHIRNFNLNCDYKIVKNFCPYELGRDS